MRWNSRDITINQNYFPLFFFFFSTRFQAVTEEGRDADDIPTIYKILARLLKMAEVNNVVFCLFFFFNKLDLSIFFSRPNLYVLFCMTRQFQFCFVVYFSETNKQKVKYDCDKSLQRTDALPWTKVKSLILGQAVLFLCCYYREGYYCPANKNSIKS